MCNYTQYYIYHNQIHYFKYLRISINSIIYILDIYTYHYIFINISIHSIIYILMHLYIVLYIY